MPNLPPPPPPPPPSGNTGQTVSVSGTGSSSQLGFPFNQLFPSIGILWLTVKYLNGVRGGMVPGLVNTAFGEFTSSDQNLTDGMYTALAKHQAVYAGFLGQAKGLAGQIVVQMVNEYQSQPNASLTQALTALIGQMQAQGQTVPINTPTVTVIPTIGNLGNAVIGATRYTPVGRLIENALPELIQAYVTADGQSGGITGQETVNFQGQAPVTDPLSWNYPGGSGTNTNIRLVDASQPPGGGTGQWLTNGDFSLWSAGLPSNWRVAAGAAKIAQSAGNPFAGNYACTFVGDGATNTGIYQILGTDTPFAPIPNDRLMVNLWAKVDVFAAAGVLEIALVDQNGTVTNDAAGNANVFTQNLSGLSSWGYAPWGSGNWGVPNGNGAWGQSAWGSFPWGANIGTPYTPITVSFRAPTILPTSLSLRLRLSTPLPIGSTLYMDRIALTRPTSLYTQGPAVAGFSGGFPAYRGDSWQLSVQNNLNSMPQTAFNQFFNMAGLGLLLPSAAAPYISNCSFAKGICAFCDNQCIGNKYGEYNPLCLVCVTSPLVWLCCRALTH